MRLVPASVRALPPEVRVIGAIAFAVAVGFGIVAPAIPVFAREFGVSRTAAASVVSVFALMRFVSALGGGALVNRLGERRVLSTGIGVVAVSSALAGLSQTYAQLLVLRGVGGIGSAMFTVSAFGLLFQVTPPHQRSQASGFISGMFLLGGITGPAFGGFVTGISARAPFFLYAASLAVAGTIGALRLPRPAARDDAAPAAEAPLSLGQALRTRAYVSAMLANLADSWAILGVRSAILPLFVKEGLERGAGWTGVGFVIVAGINGALLLPAGRLSDRRGRKPVVIGGCAITAIGMVVLATGESLAGYLVAMAVLGLGSSLLDVGPAAVLGDVMGGARAGTVVAAYQMAGDVGTVVGPLATGLLADSAGFGASFAATAGVLLLAAAVASLAPETRRAEEAA